MATATTKAITMPVVLTVSLRVGQTTRRSSSQDSRQKAMKRLPVTAGGTSREGRHDDGDNQTTEQRADAHARALVGQKGKSKEAGGSDQDGKRHHNHVQSLVARALLRLCILSSHFFDIRCAALFFCFPSLFPRFHLRSFLQTESRGQ